jgi:hypothetical protein
MSVGEHTSITIGVEAVIVVKVYVGPCGSPPNVVSIHVYIPVGISGQHHSCGVSIAINVSKALRVVLSQTSCILEVVFIANEFPEIVSLLAFVDHCIYVLQRIIGKNIREPFLEGGEFLIFEGTRTEIWFSFCWR